MILWLASEATPWASTGGLGDVVGSLPAALRKLGWDVRICLPLYAGAFSRPIKRPMMTFDLEAAHARLPIAIHEAADPPGDVPTYFVACNPLFNRAGLYGDERGPFGDNQLRFGVFQIAALHFAAAMDPAPALLHAHDWHAALAPALLAWPGERPRTLAETRTILTIHNLQYQGHGSPAILAQLRLPRGMWHPAWLEHFGGASFMKAGILSADAVTTVSPRYAAEIRTPDGGMGLDGPLRDRGDDVVGIVNGIDTAAWDPARDPALAARFSAADLGGRERCRHALRAEVGLPADAGRPIVAFVGRLTEAKGVDLLADAIPEIVAQGADVVALGSGGGWLARALAHRQHEYPDAVRCYFRFDPELARRIYAGSDVVVVPSRNEPCGLVQLYAQRYGAVPVARAAGGLIDTVKNGETGFLFEEPSPHALAAAVARALVAWRNPKARAALQARVMGLDVSWDRSAAAYDALYRRVLARPARVRALPEPVLPSDVGGVFIDWGPELPPRRGRETLRLMVQGPDALYAYWETATPGPLELIIEQQPDDYRALLSNDRDGIGDYWLRAEPERAYRALLRRPGSRRPLLISNVVLTPRDRPVDPGEDTPDWLEGHLGEIEKGHTRRRRLPWATDLPEDIELATDAGWSSAESGGWLSGSGGRRAGGSGAGLGGGGRWDTEMGRRSRSGRGVRKEADGD